MVLWRNRGGRIGLTLMETLVSVALLLNLSGLLFGSIFPALERGRLFETQQSLLRQFFLARERLVRELQHVQPLSSAPSDRPEGKVVLQYHRYLEQTSNGVRFGVFDISEVAVIDTSVVWEVFLSDRGNLVVREADNPPGTLVWGMGEKADVVCTLERQPDLIKFDFKLATEARISTRESKNLELIIVLNR